VRTGLNRQIAFALLVQDVFLMENLARAMILLFLAGAILLAGCTQPQAPPATPTPATPTPVPDTIMVAGNPLYGQILADGNGRTLYYFLKDIPGTGTSACTGACIGLWPAFSAATIRVSAPLLASDFDTITRPDGTKQATYMGWPLYYYAGDTAPGDANGYGFNSLWYVMAPTGVVTTAPTTTVATTVPTTMPTMPTHSGGGGY
jgi:predicted lipoprotein with Yx(FWY)xxD motif